MKQKLFKTMLLLCALVAGTSMSWATDAAFAPSNFSGQGTSGTGSAISATVDGVTFACDKGYGTTQIRCYSGGTITISSSYTITDISFTFSGAYNGGLSTSYTGLSTTSWAQSLSSQARITACTVTYSGGSSSAVATTTTIDASGITNTDVYTSTAAGSLSAAVTVTEGGAAVVGATVSWSGNNDAVATINASTGAVTLVGVGTVTFTASYAGSAGVYTASSKTYEMTVTSSAPDYVTLPFNWAGGTSAALTALTGVTASGLGTDYAEGNAPYRVKFDGTGDYIQIKTDSQPDKVTIGVKMLGGATTSTITVQASENGVDFDGGEVLTISGAANAVLTLETTRSFDATDCYVRLVFTKGSNVGVGPITITKYTPPVAVTGVSLKNSTILAVGDTETLTPTFTPADATNKNVSWKSSDDAVATVVDGVVTAVAEGTATITVTTEDGGKTATCDVTVKPAPAPTVTLDFTDNTYWEFPIAKEEGPATYNNGCYITLQGSSNNGYYFDTSSNNLLLGKSGATLTLPAFPFNVNKIKVYGTGGSGGSSSVTFNIFVGGVAVSSEATSSNEDHVFNIAADKQAAGTVYVIKVTNANNMRITRIEVFGYESVPVTAAGYATYCSSNALDFTSTDIEAYVGTIASKKLTFSPVTQVPANTGLLLVKDGGATVNVPVIAFADPVESCLTGVNEATTLSADDYILNVVGGKAGFYLAGEDHKYLAAHRAYITAATGAGVKAFVFDFDDATGINAIDNGELTIDNAAIYNLAGQRLNKMQKGINIVNGKKILK